MLAMTKERKKLENGDLPKVKVKRMMKRRGEDGGRKVPLYTTVVRDCLRFVGRISLKIRATLVTFPSAGGVFFFFKKKKRSIALRKALSRQDLAHKLNKQLGKPKLSWCAIESKFPIC